MEKKAQLRLIGIFIFIIVFLVILSGIIYATTTEIVESAFDVGKYSSIALDSSGYAHITHIDVINKKLRYCNNTLGSWSCRNVEDVYTSSSFGNPGIGSSGGLT